MNTCKCSKAEFDRERSETLSAQPEGKGLVTIEEEPIIGETPQAILKSWLTPNPLFYIRNTTIRSRSVIPIGNYRLGDTLIVRCLLRCTTSTVSPFRRCP